MKKIKTLKDFLKFKSGKAIDVSYPIEIFDKSGNQTYFENSDGFWYKIKFDEKSNQTYYEDSDNFWSIQEFNEEGNQIYYENSNGCIDDKKSAKEMSVADIEKELGYKVKVIK